MRVIKATIVSILIIIGLTEVMGQVDVNSVVSLKICDIESTGIDMDGIQKCQDAGTTVLAQDISTKLKFPHPENSYQTTISELKKRKTDPSRSPRVGRNRTNHLNYFLRAGSPERSKINNTEWTSGAGSLKRFLY